MAVKKTGELELRVKKAMAAVKDLEKIAKANDKIGKGTRENTKAGKEGVDLLKDRYKQFTKVLGGVAAAYGSIMAARAAWDLAEEAAKAEDVTNAFQRMTSSAGIDYVKMMGEMKDATAGTVDEVLLMKKANQAMMLGVPVGRFGDLMKIARSAAMATGQDVGYMVESVITGLGRQSIAILDNLGIIVSSEESYAKFAKSIGTTASALTDAQKKIAFSNEVLAKGLATVEKMGGEAALVAAADPFGRLATSVQDLKIAIGKDMTGAFSSAADNVASMINDHLRLKASREAEGISPEAQAGYEAQLATGDYTALSPKEAEEWYAEVARNRYAAAVAAQKDLTSKLEAELGKMSNAELEAMEQGFGVPSTHRIDKIKERLAEVSAAIELYKVTESQGPLQDPAVVSQNRELAIAASDISAPGGVPTFDIPESPAPDFDEMAELTAEHNAARLQAESEHLEASAEMTTYYYETQAEQAALYREQEGLSEEEYYLQSLERLDLTVEERIALMQHLADHQKKLGVVAETAFSMADRAGDQYGRGIAKLLAGNKKALPEMTQLVAKTAQAEIQAIAGKASIQAIWETAQGLASTAMGNFAGASAHFASAGTFALIAGAAAGGSALLGGVINAPPAADGAGGSAEGSGGVSGPSSSSGGGERTVNVTRTAPTTIHIVHNYFNDVIYQSQAVSDALAIQEAIDGGDLYLPEEVA
jgi:hypothetical protein